ncbi:unnamed protein product, partial [Allacma fusca]
DCELRLISCSTTLVSFHIFIVEEKDVQIQGILEMWSLDCVRSCETDSWSTDFSGCVVVLRL